MNTSPVGIAENLSRLDLDVPPTPNNTPSPSPERPRSQWSRKVVLASPETPSPVFGTPEKITGIVEACLECLRSLGMDQYHPVVTSEVSGKKLRIYVYVNQESLSGRLPLNYANTFRESVIPYLRNLGCSLSAYTCDARRENIELSFNVLDLSAE